MLWFMERSPNICNVGTFEEPLENVPVCLYELSPNIILERTFSECYQLVVN